MNKLIVGILLAAGESKRFGRNKLLAHVDHDLPMIVQSTGKLSKVCSTTLVVIKPHSNSIKAALSNLAVDFVVNENASEGMGSSIASAVRASSNADAWLLALGDMPFIQQSTYQLVYQSLTQGAKLVAPFYNGQRGHPVGITKDFLPALSLLQGDCGAKSILNEHKSDLVSLNCNDVGILKDIDYPKDVPIR